ncbi:ATP-binding protein [Desulforegula conservatrix]|uniref:ATP-binding protein n=1 Tax=Desulforegula conservatrix TaxID=153026 RepID=UPI0003FDB0F4|nr:ATP-binding protein [Desulforegula conservatrix]
MIGIRQKLALGFLSILAVSAVIGVMTMRQMDDLGKAIDVILRENYRSVIACQDMKEALERIDSAALISLTGNEPVNIDEQILKFDSALETELGNLTIQGEAEKANKIRALFGEYLPILKMVTDTSITIDSRREIYFNKLYPLFSGIKNNAQDILEINQKNMTDANDAARRKASSARRHLLIGILSSAIVAVLFIYLIQRWILVPLRRLIESAEEISKGRLELVIETDSRDEMGQLSEAFNSMAEGLRKFVRAERMGLTRGRRATEEIFKILPVAIAVADQNGIIELATEVAEKQFGLCSGKAVVDSGLEWLREMVSSVQANGESAALERDGGLIQLFIDNREHFFRPAVIPVRSDYADGELSGAAIVIEDVTAIREQQELKKGVISTVTHQLKTPLTSLRMSVHLLLDEKIGHINKKQTELLIAARDESERLASILDDLLDMDRIESGREFLNIKPVDANMLIMDSIDCFAAEAKDRGLNLISILPDDLPDVMADSGMVAHVLANLISNTFKFTDPGGTVTIGSERSGNMVCFSIRDTGKGISEEHIGRIFDRFYRVPGQNGHSGAGLGLAIVKQIVEAHGGTVSAESKPGKGSEFRFSLPVSDGCHYSCENENHENKDGLNHD